MDFFFRAHLIYKARSKAGDNHGQMNATNFKKLGVKKLTSNFPFQPVIVLDNSPYHCLQVDRPLSTCTVKTGMIWLCRKGIVSDETISKITYQLILPHKPKEISTKLITYWLIMLMQFNCCHTCDLNIQTSHKPKLKRLAHKNITTGMHLQKLLQVIN